MKYLVIQVVEIEADSHHEACLGVRELQARGDTDMFCLPATKVNVAAAESAIADGVKWR